MNPVGLSNSLTNERACPCTGWSVVHALTVFMGLGRQLEQRLAHMSSATPLCATSARGKSSGIGTIGLDPHGTYSLEFMRMRDKGKVV